MSWQCGHGGPGVCLACDSKRLDEIRAQAKAEGAAEEREACAKDGEAIAGFFRKHPEKCHANEKASEALLRFVFRIRARGGKPCAEWCVAETCKGWPSCREEK